MEEYTELEQTYLRHIEMIENIMVVLDDALEPVCTVKERLSVVTHIAKTLLMEPDSLELWNHLNDKLKGMS